MKILKWLVIVLFAIPVVLVGGIYIRNKAVGPVGWAEENAKKALRGMMKDPDSMIIRSSFIVRKPNTNGGEDIAICGIVNGKNGFGGYTGGTRFVSVSFTTNGSYGETFDTRAVQIEDSAEKAKAVDVKMLSGFEKVYWNENCVDAEHPALTLNDI
ncbi:hypothetical protein [Pseudoduganella sp. R-34]|uniref:hypothetical protein n=1 Tax=Pseudoduganella sp. R-34 TaxID=3404062 RepID=UPI003CE7AC7F